MYRLCSSICKLKPSTGDDYYGDGAAADAAANNTCGKCNIKEHVLYTYFCDDKTKLNLQLTWCVFVT